MTKRSRQSPEAEMLDTALGYVAALEGRVEALEVALAAITAGLAGQRPNMIESVCASLSAGATAAEGAGRHPATGDTLRKLAATLRAGLEALAEGTASRRPTSPV